MGQAEGLRLQQAFPTGLTATAIVGAGGKTSLLFRLGRAAAEPVFLANSAHLGSEQAAWADRAFEISMPGELPDFAGGVPPGASLFHGPRIPGRLRLAGLEISILERLRELAGYYAVPLFIEADGARGFPLKCPAAHEPPIPGFVDGVVVCAGMSALGKPLDERTVFRPELFSSLAGLMPGETISVDALTRVMSSPEGGLKNLPERARRIAMLNQADTPGLQQEAARLAEKLLSDYERVICASLRGPGPLPASEIHAVYRPVAGIVLAAGGSHRLGKPKQLLDWQGEPLVRRAARTALEAGLNPVVVVVGAEAELVTAALAGLDVHLSACPEWATGQSASLRCGLEEALRLRPNLGGAAFLLCDQPYVSADLIRAVREQHARSLAQAVAPKAGGRRANPVLFDRSCFPALAVLQGDAGGRQILAGLEIATVDWSDERILADIDTAGDYARLAGAEKAGG